MKKYFVELSNNSGATFDSTTGTSIKELEEWAKGRGRTFNFGEWHDYTVDIYDDNGNLIKEYQER
jgi:hypothetical protein